MPTMPKRSFRGAATWFLLCYTVCMVEQCAKPNAECTFPSRSGHALNLQRRLDLQGPSFAGRAVALLDHLDHVARVLAAGNRIPVLQDAVDQMHDVCVAVRLANLAVRSNAVGHLGKLEIHLATFDVAAGQGHALAIATRCGRPRTTSTRTGDLDGAVGS